MRADNEYAAEFVKVALEEMEDPETLIRHSLDSGTWFDFYSALPTLLNWQNTPILASPKLWHFRLKSHEVRLLFTQVNQKLDASNPESDRILTSW
jgi:hypothetical protein